MPKIALVSFADMKSIGGLISATNYLKERLQRLGQEVDILYVRYFQDDVLIDDKMNPAYGVPYQKKVDINRFKEAQEKYDVLILMTGTYLSSKLIWDYYEISRYDHKKLNFYEFILLQINKPFVYGIHSEYAATQPDYVHSLILSHPLCIGAFGVCEGLIQKIENIISKYKKNSYILPCYPIFKIEPKDFKRYYCSLSKEDILISTSRIIGEKLREFYNRL